MGKLGMLNCLAHVICLIYHWLGTAGVNFLFLIAGEKTEFKRNILGWGVFQCADF